jgi:Protein of unknown function (DUF3592)
MSFSKYRERNSWVTDRSAERAESTHASAPNPDASRMTRQTILLLALSYLGAMSFFALLFGSEWLNLRRFVNEGIETVGTVIEPRCSDHETFIYEYTVNGRTYRSRGDGGYGNGDCRDLRPGDPVRVWFLPRYPGQDVAGNPRLRLNHQSLSIVIMPIWFAIPFAIIIWRTRRHLSRARSPATQEAERDLGSLPQSQTGEWRTPLPDTFPYTARWDSVGLSCSHCAHFRGPDQWPDTARTSRCTLHGLSLAVELDGRGFMEGEWFCRDFKDGGKAHAQSVRHLDAIRGSLQTGVLYELHCIDRKLGEHPFDQLRRPVVT